MSDAALDRPRRPHSHLSARLRLTIWYGALLLVAGAVLLTLNYVLVEHSLTQNPDEVRAAVATRLGVPPEQLRITQNDERGERTGEADVDATRQLYRQVQQQIAQQHLEHLVTQSAIALASVTVLSVALGWLIAGRVLRPIHEMTATARTLSESNLNERIDLQGPSDEFKELADTFDAMLERLDTAFDAQRRFVADASHELRTPLSIIRTEVDVTLADPNATPDDLRAMGETVRDATERSERLIDSLLVLASSDAARPGTETCDLAALAERATKRLAADAATLELHIETALRPAPLEGDRALLDRLVGNLVENAIHHNLTGGWLHIQTRTTDGFAQLQITNSGTPIDATTTDHLFRRFHRSHDTRNRGTPGFGLGLSIVEAVTRVHSGTVQIQPLPDGGAVVTVDLPGSRLASSRAVSHRNPAPEIAATQH